MMEVKTPGGLRQWGPLAVLLLLLGLYRLQGLLDNPLDWDESNVLALAKLPWLELFEVMAKRDNHPPGFHALLHVWISVWGDSIWVARLFSWLLGILHVGLAYGLALELVKYRRVALLTAILVGLSPFLMRYQQMVTPYMLLSVLGVGSWWLWIRFCRFPETIAWCSGLMWSYIAVAVMMIQTQILGVWFWGIQLGYLLFCRWRQLPLPFRHRCLWVSGAAGLAVLPLLWLWMQPWYPAHLPELRMNHSLMPWWRFLLTPLDMLWLGYDTLPWPELDGWLPVFLLSAGVLGLGWRKLRQQQGPISVLIAWMTVWTLVLLYGIAWVTGLPVFHERVVIGVVFGLAFLAAYGLNALWQAGHPRWMAVLLAACVLVQWLSWQARQVDFRDLSYREIGRALKQYGQPGDGFLIIPGYHHIGIMREANPSAFGLTERERRFDPRHENIFNMVQREDAHHLYLSATDLANRPDLLQKIEAFLKAHRRVWLLSGPILYPTLFPLFSCQTIVMLPDPQGRFWAFRCPPEHRNHCRRPLDAPAAEGWECTNPTPSSSP